MSVLIRMFTNFGREPVFSADLSYNDTGDEKWTNLKIARPLG